jgi:hypothetical protein
MDHRFRQFNRNLPGGCKVRKETLYASLRLCGYLSFSFHKTITHSKTKELLVI